MQRIHMPRNARKTIQKQLNQKFSKEEAERTWNKICDTYVRFVDETPEIGGKENMMWEQLYGSLAIFSYYEELECKPSLQEIENITVEVFMGSNRIMGHFFDFNWKWFQKMNYSVYRTYIKKLNPHIQDGSWNNTWKIEINPDKKEKGVCIHLIGCPVAEFAKKHGYETILPALCASDYRVFAPLHCKLIRKHTVAQGDGYCDFWQLGDREKIE